MPKLLRDIWNEMRDDKEKLNFILNDAEMQEILHDNDMKEAMITLAQSKYSLSSIQKVLNLLFLIKNDREYSKEQT